MFMHIIVHVHLYVTQWVNELVSLRCDLSSITAIYSALYVKGLSPGTSSRIDNPLALRLHQCQQDIEKSCRTCLSIVLEYIYALILYYHVFFIVILIGCRNRNGRNRLLVGRCMGIWQWHDLLQ